MTCTLYRGNVFTNIQTWKKILFYSISWPYKNPLKNNKKSVKYSYKYQTMPFDLKWLYGNKQYSAGLISFYNIYQVSKSRDLYLSTPVKWLDQAGTLHI